MKNKYYYIRYEVDYPKKKVEEVCVINQHPFDWVYFFKENGMATRNLKDWKEISGKEYTLGKETINRE